MKLSVTVLTYNRPDLLEACLPSIPKWEGCEYLVIDNGSPFKQEVAEIARQNGFEVRRVETNVGNSAGQNLCFSLSKGDWVWFISDDVEADGMLEPELDQVGVGQIAPLFWEHSLSRMNYGLRWRWPGYGLTVSKPGARWDIIPSISYFMRRQAWEDVGGFDPNLNSSHEDVDMSLRLKQAGWGLERSMFVVIHKVNGTLRGIISDPSAIAHRNRQITLRKHYRGVDRWARILAVKFLGEVAAQARQVISKRRGV